MLKGDILVLSENTVENMTQNQFGCIMSSLLYPLEGAQILQIWLFVINETPGYINLVIPVIPAWKCFKEHPVCPNGGEEIYFGNNIAE